MNNKNGISAIVATVLIILITVAAVTIIWAAIIPMINNQLESSTLCVDAVSTISLSDIGYTCKYADGKVSLQIEHKEKALDLADIQVVVHSQGDSDVYLLTGEGYTEADFPDANEAKVFEVNAAATSATGDFEKVEIAPVVKVGNSQEVCGVSDEKIVALCTGASNPVCGLTNLDLCNELECGGLSKFWYGGVCNAVTDPTP